MIHKLLAWWFTLSFFSREERLYTADKKIYFDYKNNSINLNLDHPSVRKKIVAQLRMFEEIKVED